MKIKNGTNRNAPVTRPRVRKEEHSIERIYSDHFDWREERKKWITEHIKKCGIPKCQYIEIAQRLSVEDREKGRK